jgi:sugar phosphate isomerase/epimerase
VEHRWELGASTLGAPGAPLDEVVAILTAAGARWVELRAAADAIVSTSLPGSERAMVRSRLRDAGIDVLAVASGVQAGAAGEDRDVVSALVAHVQLAADLGARFVRVFPGLPVHDAPCDELPPILGDRACGETTAARRIAGAAGTAAGLGVRIALETHDSHPRGADVRRILDLLDPAAHDVTGAIWDLLHPWRVGEEPGATWAALAPFLLDGRGYVQIKDVASRRVLTPVVQGSGQVPLTAAARLLADGGYTGPLSLEWERTWYPHVAPLSAALQRAATALSSLSR